MRKSMYLLLACTLSLPTLADASVQRSGLTRQVVARGCSAAGLAADIVPGGCAASAVTRRVITGNVVEYSFQVRTGAGEHDLIGLHRVVRESAPSVPARARQAILFVHGGTWDFDSAFLANLAVPGASPEHAAPVFLAEHGIDVWGIDQGWTLVPAATTDFTFFKGWGLERDARDVGIALAVARSVRLATGNGLGKMDLLAWSRGGQVGYAYLNAETQVPSSLRQVNGFVPVDIFVKSDDPMIRQAACVRVAANQALLDAGTYQGAVGGINLFGDLALTNPTGPTFVPILPGFNNRQAALMFGSATYALIPAGQSFTPFYHFVGGTFDSQGFPTGLSYTPEAAWFHFQEGASPYAPLQIGRDGDTLTCDQQDVPWDDHLSEITVPVLYLGAAGGVGDLGIYSTTLLGSRDVTLHVVRLLPPDQPTFDIGHVDIWNATDAPRLFWQPLLEWIVGH